jgi:DNA-binding CsgD family transcriptional regulator
VSISSSDLHALLAVQNALLDPLSYDTTEAWLLEVCARFETLCHASASMAGFSSRDKPPRFVSPGLPDSCLDRMAELSPEPGSLRTEDPRIEGLMEGLRRRSCGTGTTADLLGPGGLDVDDLRESPMFRDVAFPLGLPGSTLLLHSGASGEFLVHASYPEIGRRPFGEATQEVLGTLLPGLAAGVGALARVGDARRAIAVLLDALEDGAVVFDSEGRCVLARNAAMSALTQDEVDKGGLQQTILQAALAAAWPPLIRKAAAQPADPRALSTGWRSRAGIPYRLRAVRLPAGSLATREAILVLVQRVGPPVPPASQLMRRFGFTRREADVAHRLAYGRSDREIAEELGLSRHTVRHHAEAVFVKTGVTSRKALALHLGSALPATRD